MAKNYTRNLRQIATYWPPAVNDGFGGLTFSTPVRIKCRWEDTAVMFRDVNGEQATSSAVVYVDRSLEIGGHLYQGIGETNTPTDGSREIRQVGKTPNLSNNLVINKVWL